MIAKTRVVAIHQPNFLPWLGFFHKMTLADVFILLDNVPFTKNSFQNRVKIKSAQGEQWLTVPVLTKGRFGQLTCEVLINNNVRWQKTHLGALRTNYRRGPYYEEVLAWLGPSYREPPARLAAFNQYLIKAVREQLGLSAELVLASALGVGGNGSELLLQLVQAVDGDLYLSGSSGRDYLDISIFQKAGIKVQFQQFQHLVYPQLYGDFIPGLSLVDLLMNVGPSKAVSYLQNDSLSSQCAEWKGEQNTAPQL
jgi:hypothetical protein